MGRQRRPHRPAPSRIAAYLDLRCAGGGCAADQRQRAHRRRPVQPAQVVRKAKEIIAVGTCAISGGVAHLGDRDDIRELFLAQPERRHVPACCPSRTRRCRGGGGSLPARLPAHARAVHGGCSTSRPISSRPHVCRSAGGAKTRHPPGPPDRLPERRGRARPLPGQPGLPVHRHLDARRLPRAVHPTGSPVRRLPRPVECLYRERIGSVAEQHPAGVHHHDRYPGRRRSTRTAFAASVAVPVPVLRLRRPRRTPRPKEKVL